jgi:hypothetical protein
MRQLLILLALCCLPLFSAAQSNNYYFPNRVHQPFLNGKKSVQATVGLNRYGINRGFDAGVTVVPHKRFLVSANWASAGSSKVRQRSEKGSQSHLFEASGGIYQVHRKGSATFQAGVGYADIYNCYVEDDAYSQLNVIRAYIQPALMFVDDVFLGGIAIRMSRLRFLKGGDIVSQIGSGELETLQNIERRGSFFIPEFSVTGGVHFGSFIAAAHLTTIFPPTEEFKFSRVTGTLALSYVFEK